MLMNILGQMLRKEVRCPILGCLTILLRLSLSRMLEGVESGFNLLFSHFFASGKCWLFCRMFEFLKISAIFLPATLPSQSILKYRSSFFTKYSVALLWMLVSGSLICESQLPIRTALGRLLLLGKLWREIKVMKSILPLVIHCKRDGVGRFHALIQHTRLQD